MLKGLTMADVKPFKGIIYDTEKVEIGEVVAPPYDVINEKLQEELHERSPYNTVRLILGKTFPEDGPSNNRYTRALRFFEEWLKEGILKKLPEEHYFIYNQTFSLQNSTYTRKALVGRVRLEDYSKGVIIPHEKTLSGPKKDRLMLLKTTKVHFGTVFGIALDNGTVFSCIEKAPKKKLFSFSDDNQVKHEFFLVSSEANREIEEAFKDKRILIADGHHRYETALNYKKEMEASNPDHTGDEPYNFVMMAIVSSKDPGLVVLPINRVIKKVDGKRAQQEIESSFAVVKHLKEEELLEIPQILKTHGKRHYAFVSPQKAFIFRIERDDDELDVTVLHQQIIHELLGITEEEIREKIKIEYFKNLQEALDLVRSGKGSFILSYNPPSVEEIASYSLKGKIMPQKSTYFYPKFYSGLVFYSLKE